MMRPISLLSALALAVLALSAVPGATAQDGGCEETVPCLWTIDVDEDGFAQVSLSNFTQGDWFTLDVCNFYDDVAHTVTLDGHDLVVEVPAGECVETDPFPFDVAGDFDLTDEPTGDMHMITVLEGDVVEEEEEDETDPGRETDDDGTPGDDNGSPGIGSVLLGITLLAIAGLVSRRAK